MLRSNKKPLGLVLTEALVALATLTTGVIALGAITTSSISSIVLSKDYLVAEGLVAEAIETVKNIRDTNWLKKPDKRQCWLALDAGCTVFPQLSNYVVVLQNGLFELQPTGDDELDLDMVARQNSQPYQLYLENSLYIGSKSPKAADLKSRFFRSVQFTSVNDESTTFEIKVQWKDGAKTREIKKKITLHNYI